MGHRDRGAAAGLWRWLWGSDQWSLSAAWLGGRLEFFPGAPQNKRVAAKRARRSGSPQDDIEVNHNATSSHPADLAFFRHRRRRCRRARVRPALRVQGFDPSMQTLAVYAIAGRPVYERRRQCHACACGGAGFGIEGEAVFRNAGHRRRDSDQGSELSGDRNRGGTPAGGKQRQQPGGGDSVRCGRCAAG